MGYEYNVKFEIDRSDEIEELLKSLPYFQKTDVFQNRLQFLYRSPKNSGRMPSAVAEIESDSIYFCDYGGGSEVLKELIYRVGLSYKKLEVIDHND